MMGGWFVSTAIGNKLVGVGGYLWGDLPLVAVLSDSRNKRSGTFWRKYELNAVNSALCIL